MKSLEEIYRDAAEVIDTAYGYKGACVAIANSSGRHSTGYVCPACDAGAKARRILKIIFAPNSDKAYWLGRPTEQNRERRVYCLLLAAEMWRDFE
jgi:hypothetical protein